MLDGERRYRCKGCSCGRRLGVLAHDGGFSVTMYDPQIEWGVFVTREEMSELLDNAEDRTVYETMVQRHMITGPTTPAEGDNL